MTETPWDAKTARAQHHINDLEQAVSDYLRSDDWRIEREQSPDGRELVLRLRIRTAPPIVISTIIGNALHNIRSALDSVTFEVSRHCAKRELTEKEEREVEFVISSAPSQEFDAFRADGRTRRALGLLSDEALRTVYRLQPFYFNAEYERLKGEQPTPEKMTDHVRWHPLTRLARLSNIDKHRYLHLTFLHPNMFSYAGDSTAVQWYWGRPAPFKDGSVLAKLVAPNSSVSLPTEVHHEMLLALQDELGHPDHAHAVLQAMLNHVQWNALRELTAHLAT